MKSVWTKVSVVALPYPPGGEWITARLRDELLYYDLLRTEAAADAITLIVTVDLFDLLDLENA